MDDDGSRSTAQDPREHPDDVTERHLREVVETLAPLVRPPCSEGERVAAEWIAERLRRAGCRDVRTEEERAWGPFPPTITGLGAALFAAAALVLRGRRAVGGVVAAGALAGFADEIQNGPRILRKIVRRAKSTVNVVAEAGDPDGRQILVVLAHHDAAQTGAIFDQGWAKLLARRAPDLMQRRKNQLPQWWLGIAPGVLTLYSSLTGSRRAARWAVGLAALGTATVADIARSPTVPGANDNLSAVAVLVGVAEALRREPVPSVRVLLVSCGAEESFQEGIRGFMARHAGALPRGRTSFLNLDTVGSTHLVMLEGEGPIWMEDYAGHGFRECVATAAAGAGVELERGVRARASTDAIIPSRLGYPTATLVSVMPWRLPGNYHLMTDTPENLDFASVGDAARATLATVRGLAAGRSPI